jgi:hypothetical protein
MPVEHIVSLLIAERDRLERAIEALQSPAKRRGRRPKHFAAGATEPSTHVPAKKKAEWSAAKRRAQGERMKAYWEKRRKAAKK